MGAAATGLDLRHDGSGVVAAIGDGVSGRSKSGQKGRDSSPVGSLAGRENDPNRQAFGIDHDVDLGAQSPTRATDGVIRAPFLPPAAC